MQEIESLIIVIAVIGISVFVGFMYFKNKGDNNKVDSNGTLNSDKNKELIMMGDSLIKVEDVTKIFDEKNTKLVEIKNTNVLARVQAALPDVTQNVLRNNTTEKLGNMNVFQVVLPKGEELVKSKDMPGAFRGFYRGENKKVKGQANLVKTNPGDVNKAANIAANAMNIGSIVVGQYYMAEIDSKLNLISDSINEINEFQEREFKSRILANVAAISEITSHSIEILENDEIRVSKINSLDNIKLNVTELLGQVNITIKEKAQKNDKIDLAKYKSEIEEYTKLVGFQNVLINALEEIGKLIYLLGKGAISTEHSYSTCNKYIGLSNQTNLLLSNWHEKRVSELNVELEKSRVKKVGIDKALAAIPAVLNEKHKYRDLAPEVAKEIQYQTNLNFEEKGFQAVYNNDVKLIIKEGKYYLIEE